MTSTYFDRSEAKILVSQVRAHGESDDKFGVTEAGGSPVFRPLKIKEVLVVKKAFYSFQSRCNTWLKIYLEKEQASLFSFANPMGTYCTQFKEVNAHDSNDVVLRARESLDIKIPPHAKIHFVQISTPYKNRIAARSAFLRTCDLVNSYLLSRSDVYFSHCNLNWGVSHIRNNSGESLDYAKALRIYSNHTFDPMSLQPFIDGLISSADLMDRDFMFPGTNPNFMVPMDYSILGREMPSVKIDLVEEYDKHLLIESFLAENPVAQKKRKRAQWVKTIDDIGENYQKAVKAVEWFSTFMHKK